MGPTIFDVLQASSGVGNANCNATTFNVTYSSVPGIVSQPATINIPGAGYDLPDDNSALILTGLPLAVIDWQQPREYLRPLGTFIQI